MSDPDRRAAARTATLVAVPVALAVAAGAFWYVNRDSEPGGSRPAPVAGPVTVSPSPLAPAETEPCAKLVGRLPDTVAGQPRRWVSGASGQAAAYGEPAIVLTCGGPAATFPPTGMLWPLNGMCWYGESKAESTVFASVDRAVTVRVTVPRFYEGQLIAEFSAPVATAIPAAANPPAACAVPTK
ncbi:DUF3515 family protein [Longispora albida]|uniref:DUF3515 family protein n=1 Tax=Longispora albida TaxID=203523 RepID=UPI0003755243|nr:DUF3515 family protein [Longispora albida]